ncbi:MAG: MFS transporter [Defluviitaleaceae bacterium]|nr:MFS transporter [Defluviitaleaceae bacterium]
MFKGLTKEEKSWIWFDWANAAYTMTVMATIMSLYFLQATEQMGITGYRANAYWAFGNTVATLIAGILAPILGTLSGYHGKKKLLFNFFTFLGILATAGLALVPESLWWLLLTVFVVSSIGFSGAIKIYDAFLIDVTENHKMDRISTTGFGWGYLGGGLAFILCIISVVLVEMNVINWSLTTTYRLAFLMTAIWWLMFSLPMFKNVKQKYGTAIAPGYVRQSFVHIWTTLKDMAQDKRLIYFLIAFFLYSDGVSSIIRMATIYGAEIGIGAMTLLLVLLAVQFVAFPFAILYGKMASKWGAKTTIYIGIATYIVICMIALLMHPDRDLEFLTLLFWALAMLVGTAQGGIQALSRSYFSKIIPKEKSNAYFGIYNVFGRFASIIGTTLFGWVAIWTGQPHLGIAVIAILFILAAIIFKFVPDDRTFNQK